VKLIGRQTRRHFLKTTGLALGALGTASLLPGCSKGNRPNILFITSDDQSWLHTGTTGKSVVRTPAFDSIARQGVLFTNAFAPAPSCGPARSAILTGQEIWRLEDAANQGSPLYNKFDVYPDLLEGGDYDVGFIGKGWFPGDVESCGRARNPAGKEWGKRDRADYAEQTRALLTGNVTDPFCMWVGHLDPHREYDFFNVGLQGIKLASVDVPPIWPDVEPVRKDIVAYLEEIERFDRDVAAILGELRETGHLENTLVIVTSDNGMPFPRAKATLYDLGTRVPLVMMWPGVIEPGRVVEDMVSLTDFAPTFLDIAGLRVPSDMTGRSLLPVLESTASGQVDPTRDRIFTARERHAQSREGLLGYPSRAIRTHDHLYIRNYAPDRWPMGDPPNFGDTDSFDMSYEVPTKEYLMEHRDDEDVAPLFDLCFGKRPAEELYEIATDPFQMKNLAQAGGEYDGVRKKLAAQLDEYLLKTNDPRALGTALWDSLPVIRTPVGEPDTLDARTEGESGH